MHVNARLHRPSEALSCVGILLASLLLSLHPVRAQVPDAAQAETPAGPATFLELTDSTLIARAWQTLFPDSLPPPGDYAALVPPARSSPTAPRSPLPSTS